MTTQAATPTQNRPRLGVLFGGQSSEHGVSCSTALEVMAVVDRDAYDVVPIGITREGQWVHEPADWTDIPAGSLPEVRGDRPAFSWDELRTLDVLFPLLHGPWGEDGTIQGMAELAGIRYVGAGVLASSVGMDKPFAKTVFAAGGIPQLPHVTVLPWQWKRDPDRVRDRIRALGLPVVVKPSRAGSSSGVVIVEQWDDLDEAIDTARSYDPKVMVETVAQNKRELECGVIQGPDGRPIASLVGEVTVDEAAEHEFYDFEAKYLDGSSVNVIPADIDVTLTERIRTLAVQAFEALGCEGLARVDFFVTSTAGGDGLVLNEINTMPGFTPFSMFPKLWEKSGVPYAELVDRLIRLALDRELGLR